MVGASIGPAALTLGALTANGTNLHGAEPRAAIQRLYAKKTQLAACRYCNRRDFRTPRIEPALQVRRALPLVF